MSESPLDTIRDSIRVITFDCYGTLIDWETGLRRAIEEVSGRCDSAIFDAYLEFDAQIEGGEYMSYRNVLAGALRRIAQRFEFDLPENKMNLLAERLPDWPVWPDTNAALKRISRKYRVGVLSNIDGDLFAATARNLSVGIDLLVTAEDVHSYKPGHAHFLKMLGMVGGDALGVLHAAQSLYHDCVPATELGITNVWINRRGEANRTTARPVAEFRDLTGLADALGV